MYKSFTGKTKPGNVSKNLTYPNLIARQWMDKDEQKQESLWIKIDDPGWLDILPLSSKEVMVVFSITRENMYNFKAIVDTIQYLNGAFSCEITPYISERELFSYAQVITAAAESNIKFWVLNNLSHFKFFPAETKKVSGHFLYTTNAFTGRVLKDLGIKYFVTSWEDDFLNIKRIALSGLRAHLIVYLFGYPPVVRSRMVNSDYLEKGIITNNRDEKFTLKYESGSMILLPSMPVMNFTVCKKLLESGISNFGIDLSFIKPDKNKWDSLYKCYIEKKNLLDTVKFNFKRGLK